MYNVYVDESCQNAHRYLVLGCIVVDAAYQHEILGELLAARARHNLNTVEVKWKKSSRRGLPLYKEFVDVYIKYARLGHVHFHCMYVESSTVDHSHNSNDADTSLNKLIYQLMLHRVGRRYAGPIYVYVDERPTHSSPDAIRPMLNAVIAKYGDASAPFRRLSFIDSHKSDIVQITDLLIGAVGFRKNNRHKLADASPHKVELGEYIARKCGELERKPNASSATRFTLWKFAYRKKVVLAS